MSKITSYRDLTVWRRAMDLVEAVYGLTKSFPKQEEYRLTSQLVRAAVSIPANIAEGYMWSTRKDYGNFVGMARGSAAELETLIMLAGRLKFAPPESVSTLLASTEEVSRMLNTLRQRLSSSPKT